VSTSHKLRPVAVVIGCDDIGSAIAWTLHCAGLAVALVDAADPPWPRRGMSYTDAWYVGGATLEQVDACFCTSVRSVPTVLARGDMIAATTWSWEGVVTALHAPSWWRHAQAEAAPSPEFARQCSKMFWPSACERPALASGAPTW